MAFDELSDGKAPGKPAPSSELTNDPVPRYKFAPVWSSASEHRTIKNASNVVIVSPNETKYALLGSGSGGLTFIAIFDSL
jgi:hypothetical protein